MTGHPEHLLSSLAEQILIEPMLLKTKRRNHVHRRCVDSRVDNGTARSRP
jgi:hypothetical protein